MVCELTGMDRAAFCNTGSEAVMGALRIARIVTGRSLVVAFAGSYHGIFDEVIVRDTKNMRSVPAAPGILPEAVQNMLVLEYGTDQTLARRDARARRRDRRRPRRAGPEPGAPTSTPGPSCTRCATSPALPVRR